jgi:hypothetical protein
MVSRLHPRRLAGLCVTLAGMLSLAACSLPGATTTPDAASILKNAQAVKISDASLSFSYSGQFSSNVVSSLPFLPTGTLTGVGDGKMTTSPQRADITFNVPISGLQVPIELLYDGDTKTLYAGSSLLATVTGASQTWVKLPLDQVGGVDRSAFLNFSQLLNVSLVGTETLNGVATYHLKGTDSPTGQSATVDLWVQQSNYDPVRAVINLNTFIVGTATVDFTGLNTGLTITPPSSDQVFNG